MNGKVKAKFIGKIGKEARRKLPKQLWVPKALVSHVKGPKLAWLPKLNIDSIVCRWTTKSVEDIGCLIAVALNK